MTRPRSKAAILWRTFRDLALALLLSLALVEAGVRVLGLDPGQHMIELDVEPEDVGDAVYWPMPDRYDPDGDGLRGAGVPGPESATSVVLLGDSILFGVRLPEDRRVGALLAREFKVFDTAVPGYASAQMRIALQRLLDKQRSMKARRPDAVVVG